MKSINNSINKIVIITYILFYITYEYMSIMMYSDLTKNIVSDYIYITILNVSFLVISIFIIKMYNYYSVQIIVILALIISSIVNVIVYMEMNQLNPYSLYIIVLLICAKIFIIMFCLMDIVYKKKKIERL
ncbi:MAG: hypothetical protein U9N10_05140 [Bacillota bacterium]|nr:hypothetical protein [Bacillota bacterium]